MIPRHFSIASVALYVIGFGATRGPSFTQAYALAPTEGVFAYSRISPDGAYLAYASQAFDTTRPRPRSNESLYGPVGAIRSQTVTIVELRTKRVLFSEPGTDAYWSLDGERVIYAGHTVSIWHRSSGEVSRDVALRSFGDYYSWALRNGRNLILTIDNFYYYLNGDRAVLPVERVLPCPGIGRGERPLISKDGRRISTFVRGNVVVRGLTDCDSIFDTGIAGAKADFSFDGRYIAFHAQRPNTNHYDILVVDLARRTVRNVTKSLSGSSLFPNFTRDARLSFRYDSSEYRGFMFVSGFLSLPAAPLPRITAALPVERSWNDVLPGTRVPGTKYTMVLIWSSWSAHSPVALTNMQQARAYFRQQNFDIDVLTAAEPASQREDLDFLRARNNITLSAIRITPAGLLMTEARNQVPTTLLFHGDKLIDRRLGAQTFEELRDWAIAATGAVEPKASLGKSRPNAISSAVALARPEKGRN
jgi:hypothetical protein